MVRTMLQGNWSWELAYIYLLLQTLFLLFIYTVPVPAKCNCSLLLFIHSLQRYLLNTYYVLGILLDTGLPWTHYVPHNSLIWCILFFLLKYLSLPSLISFNSSFHQQFRCHLSCEAFPWATGSSCIFLIFRAVCVSVTALKHSCDS